MPVIVSPITTEVEVQAAFAIRLQVFVQEHGFPRDEQIDALEREPNTFHFIAKDTEHNKYVATVRCIVLENERKCKIGRVAVLSECRGKSVGLSIMRTAKDAIKSKCEEFVVSAVLDKAGFYEKCGYGHVDNDVYIECGVPHTLMAKAAWSNDAHPQGEH